MKTVRKIALGLLLIALSFVLSYWFFPGEVVAIRVEAIEVKTVGVNYSPALNKEIIKEIFGKDAAIATRIATCESNLKNNARGDSGWSIGLFQIYTKVHSQYSAEQLSDPIYNTTVAKKIFDRDGWKAWTCSKTVR